MRFTVVESKVQSLTELPKKANVQTSTGDRLERLGLDDMELASDTTTMKIGNFFI